MPTMDISVLWNMLLGGIAVVLAVVWLFIHLSAARDLRESSSRGFN